MKNIYLIILSLISFYSHSQIENTEVEQRWEVIGSKNDGTVLLKLKGRNLYKFSFFSYQSSNNKTIQSIYLNSSSINVDNLYSFLLNSFDLIESRGSSFRIDKYVFQVLKTEDDIRVSIKSINLNETIGRVSLTRGDVNYLFGKY